MRLRHFATLLTVLVGYTRALDLSTATKTVEPSITPAAATSECWGMLGCSIWDYPTIFQWQELRVSTTITAATKVLVVDEGNNATISTSLIFNDIGAHSFPPMNEAGTQTWEISYTGMDRTVSTTVLTWPSTFVQYPSGYYWKGMLQYRDPNGTCVLHSASGSKYKPYPPYATTQARINWDYDDENGLNYIPVIQSGKASPNTDLNMNDPILQSCMVDRQNGAIDYAPKARFLTVTSVSRKKSSVQTLNAAEPAANVREGTVEATPAATIGIVVGDQAVSELGSLPSSPQATSPIAQPDPEPNRPAATTTITGPGFSFTLAVPNIPNTQKPSSQQPAETTINGRLFVPFDPSIHTITGSTDNSGAMLQTVVNGKTFIPVSTTGPSLVIAGSTITPVATIGGVGPVYNVGGQALTVGSTITLGFGAAAQTIALQRDGLGNTVLTTASSGRTGTSTIARTTSGGRVGGSLKGSDTVSARVALQTVNVAGSLGVSSPWSYIAIMVFAIIAL